MFNPMPFDNTNIDSTLFSFTSQRDETNYLLNTELNNMPEVDYVGI